MGRNQRLGIALGLLLWSLIEAPVRGWTSSGVLAAGVGGLAVLGLFIAWGHRTTHPMPDVAFFKNRVFSGAVCSVSMVTFGLFGTLFLLTQYLQFGLGYCAMEAGIRVLPAAGMIAVVAPLSALALRVTTVRHTVAAALACIAAGLWLLSGITVASTYASIVPGIMLLGAGAGWPCRPRRNRSWARCPAATPASARPLTARSCRPAGR